MARMLTLGDLLRAADSQKMIEGYGDNYDRLLVPLFKYVGGSQLLNSVSQRLWVKDFDGTGDFDSSLHCFQEDPNGTTIALIEHLEIHASTILAIAWYKRVSAVDGGFVEMDEKLGALRFPPKSILMNRGLAEALDEFEGDVKWCNVCQRVKKFALLAGCPRVLPNVFDTMDALRATIAFNPPDSHKAKLLEEVEQLRKRIADYEKSHQRQTRIIASLSYRYLLEHLPGPASKNVSNTSHWQAFWNQALQNAGQTPFHPLAVLLHQFGDNKRSLAQIRQVGEGMYATLSTNIHHFRGVYSIDPNQWDELPGAILRALSPTSLNTDGSVDWTLERARY